MVVVLDGLRLGDVARGEGVERLDVARGPFARGEVAHEPRPEGRVRVARVGDDQPLRRAVVFEEVVDALALHPAVEKVEVALLVLADVLVGAVAAVEAERVVAAREAARAQRRLEDVGRRLLRVDPRVLVDGELPEPGHHLDAIERRVGERVEQLDRRHDAAALSAHRARVVVDAQRRRREEGGLGVEARRLGDGHVNVDLVAIGASEALAPRERRHLRGGHRVALERQEQRGHVITMSP